MRRRPAPDTGVSLRMVRADGVVAPAAPVPGSAARQPIIARRADRRAPLAADLGVRVRMLRTASASGAAVEPTPVWALWDEGMLAGGHDATARSYDDLSLPMGHRWTFGPDWIRFDFEDSHDCTYPQPGNPHVQSFRAERAIAVPAGGATLGVDVLGAVETVNTGYERLDVEVRRADTAEVVLAAAAFSVETTGSSCVMGQPEVYIPPSPLVLPEGQHTLIVRANTVDALYHLGAYYRVGWALA